MATTSGIKINNTVLTANNLFKFITVIDIDTDGNIYIPIRVTVDNEQEIFERWKSLKKLVNKGYLGAKNYVKFYTDIVLPNLPRSVTDDWNDGDEVITWLNLKDFPLFELNKLNHQNEFTSTHILNEEWLNLFIRLLYFYENIGTNLNEQYIPFDEENAAKALFSFGGSLPKQFIYFYRPLTNDCFHGIEFAQANNSGVRDVATKPIVHTFYPSHIEPVNGDTNKTAKAKTTRIYVYDTSSTSVSSTESHDMSYMPLFNAYKYGAISFFRPNEDYATPYINYHKHAMGVKNVDIKSDLVTKREVAENKLKSFHSQELNLRIAGAVSLSGRLQWEAKGYKYQDETRYSRVEYVVTSEKLNFDKDYYRKINKQINKPDKFLRIKNIALDLNKCAIPVQIHTPIPRARNIQESFNSGFLDRYKYSPPIMFRIKDNHTLDVSFSNIDVDSVFLPYVFTTSASHLFLIDVSVVDKAIDNFKYKNGMNIPDHLKKNFV